MPGTTVANRTLVIVNVLVFVLAQTPAWYLSPGAGWWSVLTYGFSHGTPWHLIGNMYVLLIVGDAVNRRIGSVHYLAAYLGTILLLGILGRWLDVGPLMGSSCGIFALVAILVLLMPGAVVDFSYVALFPATLITGWLKRPDNYVEWFLRWGEFRARAWWCLLVVPVLEVWGMIWWRYSLGSWQLFYPAHLLGFFCGVGVVLLLPTRITMPSQTCRSFSW